MKKSQPLLNAACGFCGVVALSIGLNNNNSIANTLGTGLLTASFINSTTDHIQKQTKTALEKKYSQGAGNVIHNQPKTRVFFDGANTDGTLKELGIEADYQAFVSKIAPSDAIIKYYYGVSSPQTESENRFSKYLESINFQVVKSRKKSLPDGTHKIKGDDVQIATDIANDAKPNDNIILVSGDGDFEYAITKLKAKGCQVTVISSDSHISFALKKVTDHYIDINALKDSIKRQPKPRLNSQVI